MFKILIVCALLFLTGCLLPQAPKEGVFKSIDVRDSYEIISTFKSRHLPIKNVLFFAADDTIQIGFQDVIKNAYNSAKSPRLEDIVWWDYSMDLKNIYNTIVRIPYDKAGYDHFISALRYLEFLGQPYDVILLTHGGPNHLSSGKGYFFSFRELQELRGQLKNLNLVLQQACFGSSLAPDWLAAGAKSVVSYPGLNRNFFFFGFFLKYYYPGSSVNDAYQNAKRNMDFQISKFPYNQILKVMMGAEVPNYVLKLENPQLFFREISL